MKNSTTSQVYDRRVRAYNRYLAAYKAGKGSLYAVHKAQQAVDKALLVLFFECDK